MSLVIVDSWRDLPPELKGASVAIGAFDGVHLGHRAVIGAAGEAAARLGVPLAVATFEPHPRRWFEPDGAPFRLTNPSQQAQALDGLGVDILYRLPFDQEMVRRSPEAFISELLVAGLGVRHVTVGFDFTFGARRAGKPELLIAEGQRLGFEVEVVAPFQTSEGDKVSSSAIREALSTGRPEDATAMLGRPYTIQGVVVHGDHLGRTIGFPTANIAFDDFLRPAYGIYAAQATLEDGRRFDGAAYIGRRPAVGGKDERLEVNLFDFDEEIYGQVLTTKIIAFLRGDRWFESLDALKAQTAKDVERAKEILGGG
jgi:riboflavin kinase/FMN adenylyltransferase